MFVILVYDIEEKRVQKVHKICKKYLTWIQNSVFEGEITEADLKMLKNELMKVIDRDYDSIIIYKFKTRMHFDRENLGVKAPSGDDMFF